MRKEKEQINLINIIFILKVMSELQVVLPTKKGLNDHCANF